MYIFRTSFKIAVCALVLPTLVACASPHSNYRRASRKLTLYGTDNGDLGVSASKAKAYDEVTLISMGGGDAEYQVEGGWGTHKIAMASKEKDRDEWLRILRGAKREKRLLAAGYELGADGSKIEEWWVISGP